MAQVNFIINSTTYPISCKEGQEDKLLRLQALISKKEAEILKAFNGNISGEKLLLMIAIVLADDASNKTSEPQVKSEDISLNLVNEKIRSLKNKIDLMNLKI